MEQDKKPVSSQEENGTSPNGQQEPVNNTAAGEGLKKSPVTLPEARILTRERARDLRALLAKYIRLHLPPPAPEPEYVPEPPRVTGAHAKLLPFLKTTPWILSLMFLFSFYWDFEGTSISLWGYTAELEGLLRINSVSGLIGFLTNWLAITMLFNPRQKRPIFGQGLIPAQRERVIYRLAQAVSKELINEKIIKQKIEESGVIPRYREMAFNVTRGVLEDPNFRQELKQLTSDYAEQVLGSEETRRKITELIVEKLEQHAGQGFGGLALKTYRFLNEADFQRRIDKAVRELPSSLDTALNEVDVLLDRLPEKLEARSEEIEEWVTKIVLGFVEKLDVYEMIVANMNKYNEQQLENLLKNTSNEQLNYIKYLGGILGFVGGLVIWRPGLALSIFCTAGLILYIVDEFLFRTRHRMPG